MDTDTNKSPATNTPATSPNTHFPFLYLPYELRLRIYDLALTSPTKHPYIYPLRAPKRYATHPDYSATPSPGLLRTIHQIHTEATPLLYQLNAFSFKSSLETTLFLRQIGLTNCAHIRTLQLHITEISTPKARREWCHVFDTLARDASGLRVLCVDFRSWRRGVWKNLGGEAEVRDALERVKVRGRVELWGPYGVEWPRYLRGVMGCEVLDLRYGSL